MGVRFDLGSSNVLGYLTSGGAIPPRLRRDELWAFLSYMSYDRDPARPRLISSSPEWVDRLRRSGKDALDRLQQLAGDLDWFDYVEAGTVLSVLAPVAQVFGSYDLYVLPVGTWRDADALDRFAIEAARLPGHGILVLIPDFYEGQQNIRVMTPNEGTVQAVKNRETWPGAIFLLRTGESLYLPLERAYLLLFDLFNALNSRYAYREFEANEPVRGLDRARMALADAARDTLSADEGQIRILHLSDLHFGTNQAAITQNYLLATLRREYESIDQIVITGDLFDQPRKLHAQQFKNFAQNLHLLSHKVPIVVPGNHDQRIFGNSFLGFGRRLRQLADLHWQPIVRDDERKLVFFCFDSARGADLSRGQVDKEQLLSMATDWAATNSIGHYDDYLKVSLVHHHPYPYRGEQELSTIIDPRGWLGREKFIELEGASEFLSWCAGRGVGLILHGHKHIPRLITDVVEYGSSADRRCAELTTVGCGSSLGAKGGRLSYNLVDWRPATRAWSVDFQIDRGDGQGFTSAVVESRVIPVSVGQ